MANYTLIDEITGDRAAFNTRDYTVETLATAIAEAFFPPLVEENVPDLATLEEAISDLASDMQAGTVCPGPLEYLALKIV